MIRIEPYHKEYEIAIRSLCQIPVSGNIALSMERDPDYYAGACIQCEEPEVYVCFSNRTGELCAMFNVGFRRVYYQGEIRKIRYLCDLRIRPSYQKSRIGYHIGTFLSSNHIPDNILPAQTIIFADNNRMITIIEKHLSHSSQLKLPVFHYTGTYISNLVTFKSSIKKNKNIIVRSAEQKDIETMQHFFDKEASKIPYYPYYNFRELEKPYYSGIEMANYYLAYLDNELVGICGVWDQSDMKQTRVVEYNGAYKWLRPLYNAYANFAHKPLLPPKGNIIKYMNLHTILIKKNDEAIFKTLLGHIVRTYQDQGFAYYLCGFDQYHPLQQVINRMPNKRQVKGYYYLVNKSKNTDTSFYKPWFYLEAARI